MSSLRASFPSFHLSIMAEMAEKVGHAGQYETCETLDYLAAEGTEHRLELGTEKAGKK